MDDVQRIKLKLIPFAVKALRVQKGETIPGLTFINSPKTMEELIAKYGGKYLVLAHQGGIYYVYDGTNFAYMGKLHDSVLIIYEDPMADMFKN